MTDETEDEITKHLANQGVKPGESMEQHRKMLSRLCPHDPKLYQILGNPNSSTLIINMG